MSWSFLFMNKNNIDNLDTTTNSIETHTRDEEKYNKHDLTITKSDSFLTTLNRIGVYCRHIIFDKVRLFFTYAFVTMLNIATRLTSFKRQRTPLSPVVTSPSIRTLEKDLNTSSTSLLHFDTTNNQLSLDNSPMANILVRQQSHRTPNMNIHRPTSSQNETFLTMSHSFDDRLFFYKEDQENLLHLFQRFRSEPHMSMNYSTSNGFLNKNATDYNLSSSLPNTFLPVNEPVDEEDDVNVNLNCDRIQPVTTEDLNSDKLDNISSIEQFDEIKNEDVIINTNASFNIDRHFRRRKRRSSLTRTSTSIEEIELLLRDLIEKIDVINQEKKSESLPTIENNDKKEELNDKINPVHRLRGRRLRNRFYRQTPSISEESTPDNILELFLPTEKVTSPPPSISPPSPISPIPNVSSSDPNPNTLASRLKRNNPAGTTKKSVRFADTIGRELTQVQYIQLSPDEESKNKLYVPKTSNSEYKPWSFDITSSSKQVPDVHIPKRFFCLYRQPNSEHPDAYLHEVWKSQIKLEHADIRLKSFSTNEQYLHGTLWVTNASYWKYVTIKYTFNRWSNTNEYDARYRCHSNDFRNIDQFEFNIDIPHDVDRIDFVIRYSVNGQEYWDNNYGNNYTLETESAYTPQTTISLPHDCDLNEMRFY